MSQSNALPSTNPVRTGLVSVDGRTYPLKSTIIEARAEGGVAFTTFTQEYSNPYAEPLEVEYVLPLPANGAVIGYSIRLGRRIIRGEVRRREEAQAEYKKALFEGRTAALLEQVRSDTFTQKLGCLPPGEAVEAAIEVIQPLAFLAGDSHEVPRWEYRFPTVIGVRYEGTPGRVPDAGELNPDRAAGDGTGIRLEANLLVADGPGDMVHPQIPGQEIELLDIAGGVRVSLRDKMKLDRDLVVRWLAGEQEVGVRLVHGNGLVQDNGRYVLLTLTPPLGLHQGLARDLTLLMDASGSMSGKPLARAKTVAEELLLSLDPGDRFEIMAFASAVAHLTGGPVEANKGNIQRALAALHNLQAGGATEMTQAMIAALQPLRPDSQRQVILLSDGYIGFEGEVIAEIAQRLAPGARLHTVGIGAAPNRTLTRGAARAGRGVEILVADDDDAKAASQRLLRATVKPVLTDLEIVGSAVLAVAPRRPQDVFEGQPLVVTAKIAPIGGILEIRGKLAGTSETWIRSLEIPAGGTQVEGAASSTSIPVGALFGREAIEDFELDLAAARAGSETRNIEKKIEDLGLRHGIASRRTSLVAISEDPTVDPKNPRRRECLAVEVPAEVSAEGAGLVCHAMAPAPSLALPAFLRPARSPGSRMVMETSGLEMMDHVRGLGAGKHMFSHLDAAPEIVRARVLHTEDRLLVFEFEVPVDRFLLPEDGAIIDVRFEDGQETKARVSGELSSPRKRVDKGLTVRLALILDAPDSWNHGTALMHWVYRRRSWGRTTEAGEIQLEIALDENR